MKLVVISTPHFFKEEADAIQLLFENNLTYFHLRKPQEDRVSFEKFLNNIDAKYHTNIIIHNHFDLCNDYVIKGIHHNSNTQNYKCDSCGFRSRACHTFDEVVANKNNYDYLLLSPIFHSISKEKYLSAFTDDELKIASINKIIDHKVIAMGGVTLSKIQKIKDWNFGGIAVLGYMWNDFLISKDFQFLISRFNALQYEIKK